MAKRNQVSFAGISFAGIPVKERARVKRLMHFYAGGLDVLPGDPKTPKTPQEVWAYLTAHWETKRNEEQKKAEEDKQQRADNARKHAIGRLAPALQQLVNVRDLMHGIEQELDGVSYLGYEVLAGFARLAISEAGSDLEQALCDLGLVTEAEYGSFVDNLKSEGIKLVIPEEEKEAAE